jgi:hypothetical protein
MSVKFTEPSKDNADILRDTIETLELTIRAARRCAYDLRHCTGMLNMPGRKDPKLNRVFEERAAYFLKLFQSGNTCKDYRHNLHRTIDELEGKIERLRGILAEHKIVDPTASVF